MLVIIIGVVGISFMIFLVKINYRNVVVSRPGCITNKSSGNSVIEWVIKADEKKIRTREKIKKSIFYFFPFAFFLAILEYYLNSKSSPIVGVSLILLMSLFVFALVPFCFFRKRQYIIDNSSIYVARGNKSKKYMWEDFEYFYIDPDRSNQQRSGYKNEEREEYIDDLKRIEGEAFYLKMKPANILSRLVKNVLVIYTEPDNCNEIHNFLSQKLTKRNGLNISLIHYQFK